MIDRIAQAGLGLTGIIGILGALTGLNNDDTTLFGYGIIGAALSFFGLLIILWLSYRDLNR